MLTYGENSFPCYAFNPLTAEKNLRDALPVPPFSIQAHIVLRTGVYIRQWHGTHRLSRAYIYAGGSEGVKKLFYCQCNYCVRNKRKHSTVWIDFSLNFIQERGSLT